MRDSEDILVLMLDDDTTWLRSLSRVLRLRQADCVTFTQPEKILETLAERVPNVMVFDYVLGGGWTGADVARAMRQHLRTSCPPLLLVSSTLPDVGARDLATFDAAFDKWMPIDGLVEEIITHAATYKAATSQSVMRAAVAPDEVRRQKRRTPS